MAAFSYPLEALVAAGALLLVTFLIYEGTVLWKRHHVSHPRLRTIRTIRTFIRA
jgi:hypothetical protein